MAEISSFGSRALFVSDIGSPARLAQRVEALGLGGLCEIIPAAVTMTITFETTEHRDLARDLLGVHFAESYGTGGDVPDGPDTDRLVELRCRFDGPDLAGVGEATGLGIDGVVTALTTARLQVAFCGFSPGFAYLAGLPERLHLPRRSTPRPRIEAGSVAIASHYAAVYPTASPGGWHLVGSTAASVWQIDHEPPALLRPGTVVRLIDATDELRSGQR